MDMFVESVSIQSLLVDQMNRENQNARYYKSLAGICDIQGFSGFAKFLNSQSSDELEHYNKIFEYLCARNWNPIQKNQLEIESDLEWTLIEIMSQVLTLEMDNLSFISIIKDTALEQKDWRTVEFLIEFINIQTSEIKEMGDLKNRLLFANESPAAILLIDSQLSI